jgi:hypothetical protein
MSMSAWIATNTFLRKKPFSFDAYGFQRAIVDDMHPNLDVIKCSQVGLTEVQMRKMLAFLVRNSGVKAIFTLPNEKMFKRVSKTRIQPTVEGSPVFNPEGYKDWTRSMDLMQFDQSFLYITGATEGDATSIDADAVFNDEVDLTDQQMLALFNSRMQNSQWRLSQRFSTPTHVGYGIDKGYAGSDQQEYMCKCHACRHWNIPDFTSAFITIPGLPDHVGDLADIEPKLLGKLKLDRAGVHCERCGAPLDLDNPDMREWVPRHPDRSQSARGYLVRPFVTSRLDVKYIVEQLLKYKERDFLRGWYNTVLGKAFTDSNARLTEPDIRANFVQPNELPIEPHEPAFVGIDAGLMCHVTIGKMTPAGMVVCGFLTVPADEIEHWAAEFEASHNLIAGAMDRHPYTPTANAVFEATKGKIFPVEYRGQREVNPVKNELDEVRYFQANRTLLIDAVVKLVRRHKLPMAGYGHFSHQVIEHLRDMVRDESPEKEATWVKLNGNDHYFHSLGFLLFSSRIEQVLTMLNDADVRDMVGLFGVDLKQPNDVLSGSSKRQSDNLFVRERGSRFSRR